MKTTREEKAEAQKPSASASLSNPICACGHRSTQHSYSADVDSLDENLYCDICNCENFRNVSASLSDKIHQNHFSQYDDVLTAKDVREAVRELRDRWKKIEENLMAIEKTSAWDILDECRKQIDEIFGKDLI